MNEPALQWATSHTAGNQMIHDFGNEFQIVVDKNINMAYKIHSGETKDCFSTRGMALETYVQILVNFAKSVQHHKKEIES